MLEYHVVTRVKAPPLADWIFLAFPIIQTRWQSVQFILFTGKITIPNECLCLFEAKRAHAKNMSYLSLKCDLFPVSRSKFYTLKLMFEVCGPKHMIFRTSYRSFAFCVLRIKRNVTLCNAFIKRLWIRLHFGDPEIFVMTDALHVS